MSKINILGDVHCHTLASVHAFSTIRENIDGANRKGLKLLAITDHGIGANDAPPLSYFRNLKSLPKYVDGLRLLKGVEANIMDLEGNLDLPDSILKTLDIVVVSFHASCVKHGTKEDHTKAYLALAKNPYVHIMGHSGTPEFEYDLDVVIPAWRDAGKYIEINAHTFVTRKKSIENCKTIALACKKYQAPIVVNSDSHHEFEIGDVSKALELLEEIDFPKELIKNASLDWIKSFD